MADDNQPRQPVTTKTTQRGENDRLEYAVSSMQGYRRNMEDAHAAFEDFDVPTATSFFGVYDGHGGPDVSMYCARHLHLEIRKHPEFTNNLPTAVDGAFSRMDQMMTTDEGRRELTRYWDRKLTLKDMLLRCACFEDHPGPIEVGSTACVALIRGNQIIVGNAGDCRCVLSRNRQAIVLTTDHKPSVLAERQRILNAGHFVEVTQGVSRVDNEIAVARSIGDMRYKSNIALPPALQALTCAPEIRSENITDDAEFLVMACDGVWDVVDNQGFIDYIHLLLAAVPAMNLGEVCEALLDEFVERSRDNMTVLLVRFKHNAQAPDVPEDELPGVQQEDQSTDDELPGVQQEDQSTDDELPGVQQDQSTDDELPGVQQEDQSTDDELPGVQQEDQNTNDELPGAQQEDQSTDDELQSKKMKAPFELELSAGASCSR
ncbi:probable protein phosphatase 2C 42 isoform X2 [Brachypodium distachyon]|nr:probable protein phosphatase 2C 42 isoform X2 [Brachypodium distachyon]XP_014751562.1 probable protein phosphatase 2C 42 isoform X2 [Brachypodium distachyon]XP_014751563.1 probable protein phosphatase 2C 42 isoform X2 [Brachypodium distachyon]XP_024311682.1 probable protein phosphatase 2C 42 isoform X2 [Brachypodium distachyon]PNT61390.1 hypothetical protein BRADI_5g14730v3 [Brachypodium distachyon]PNT61391.1 hypothetical protein BRADI_5g14730v3 [Brachypodium distachyon]|eukprot:XP_014751561.1 probable protein phosphatase 2C 42 isoform X2 [Brachypodium distachyon]